MECRWQGRVGPAATSGGALGFPDTCGSGLSGFGWAPVPTGSCCWPQPHREPLVLKAKLKWGSREGGDWGPGWVLTPAVDQGSPVGGERLQPRAGVSGSRIRPCPQPFLTSLAV